MPRLDALLARNLDRSRRQIKQMLRAGRICDEHGQRLDDPRLALVPSQLPVTIQVDGTPLQLRHRFSLVQHKPIGVITALADPRHRTAYELLTDAPLRRELRAVGRLDLDTSGLLLWTTDGTLLHRLTHPRYAVPRQYQAGLRGDFDPLPPNLTLNDGHRPRIVELVPLSAEQLHPALRRSQEARVFASITLTTGRFHEVRRIFAALGTEVVDLCRVRYGCITLPPSLPAGDFSPVDLHAAFHGLSPALPPESTKG